MMFCAHFSVTPVRRARFGSLSHREKPWCQASKRAWCDTILYNGALLVTTITLGERTPLDCVSRSRRLRKRDSYQALFDVWHLPVALVPTTFRAAGAEPTTFDPLVFNSIRLVPPNPMYQSMRTENIGAKRGSLNSYEDEVPASMRDIDAFDIVHLRF